MRPVVHPPQPAANVYPEFRLDTIPHLKSDEEDYEWDTPDQNPYEYWDQDDLDAWDALRRCLLELIFNPPVVQPKKKAKKAKYTLSDVKHSAENFRDRTYKKAADPLVDGLGRYCSYCEQHLTEMIAVEHDVAAKAPYPLFGICWLNFLLGCRSCNSHKKSQPDRSVAWLPKTKTDAGELNRYKAIAGHYLWPQTGSHMTTNVHSYTAMLPVLFADTGGGFAKVDDAVSVNDALVLTQEGDRRSKVTKASVPFTTGALDVPVQVRLVPSAPALAQAQASFEMLDLGNTGAGSGDDNRMLDRTLTWLTAVAEFRKLAATSDFANQWDTVCKAPKKTGFLTTWVRVLDLRGGKLLPYPAPPAVATSTLLKEFLQVLTTTGLPQPAFPNTDLRYLPS